MLKVELPRLQPPAAPRQPLRPPVVLIVARVTALLARMAGEHGLSPPLLYGTGMGIDEAPRSA